MLKELLDGLRQPFQAKLETVKIESGETVALVPEGHEIESLDKYLDKPKRLKAKASFNHLQHFCDYINHHKTDDTVIFTQIKNGLPFTVDAVIDYHKKPTRPKDTSASSAIDSPAEVKLGDHRVHLSVEHSKEFTDFMKIHRKSIPQRDFGEFIEDNFHCFVSPDAMDMITLARTFEAKGSAEFKSAIREQNGEIKFTLIEEIKGSAGINGSMSIPEKFKISIPIFLHGSNLDIEVDLRYRIIDGKLSFIIVLRDIERIILGAYESMRSDINTKTGIDPLIGSLNSMG